MVTEKLLMCIYLSGCKMYLAVRNFFLTTMQATHNFIL